MPTLAAWGTRPCAAAAATPSPPPPAPCRRSPTSRRHPSAADAPSALPGRLPRLSASRGWTARGSGGGGSRPVERINAAAGAGPGAACGGGGGGGNEARARGGAEGFAASVMRQGLQAASNTVAVALRETETEMGAASDSRPQEAAALHLPSTTSPPRSPDYSPAEVFMCREESLFYSQVLEKMLPAVARRHRLLRKGGTGAAAQAGTAGAADGAAGSGGAAAGAAAAGGAAQPVQARGGAGGGQALKVVEFGSGDGQPVISAITRTRFEGVVYGFELNPISAGLARSNAAAMGLSEQYQISTGCFYHGVSAPDSPAAGAECLIANPPYLPAPDSDILMPELWGGRDGSELTGELLSMGFPYAVMLISSFSNPAAVLRHAAAEGYRVVDFQLTPLQFGTYSSEPKVRSWIQAMRTRGEAFYSGKTYMLAGVLFEKKRLPKGEQPVAAYRRSCNGNGGGGAVGTVYHLVDTGQKTDDDDDRDISPQLLRVLTAL